MLEKKKLKWCHGFYFFLYYIVPLTVLNSVTCVLYNQKKSQCYIEKNQNN